MQALFNKRQFYTAKLFTFSLIDGTILNYCSGDQDLTVSAVTYSAGGTTGPFFEKADKKAKTHRMIGTATDQMIFDVLPGAATIEGFPFLVAVRFGLFDGADFLYQRINMATPGDTSAGAILMFGGLVGQVDYSNSAAQFTINSYLHLLDIQLPRNVWQPGCLNTLFDAGCTLSAAAFLNTGAVTNAVTPSGQTFSISGTAAGQATGFFNLGRVQFTSGANAGISRVIQNYVGGGSPTITVFPPFGNVPAVGDAFNAYPGCDKSQATCTSKFSNLTNFRGMPYVPNVSSGI